METMEGIAYMVQLGLGAKEEAMRLVLLSMQTGYNLKAMEEQEKKAG